MIEDNADLPGQVTVPIPDAVSSAPTGAGEDEPPSTHNVVPGWYVKGIKLVLLSLLLIQVVAMIWGTVETALAAFRQVPNGLLMVLKSLVVNSLLVLALLEVSRTVMAYFILGRVKVTFIVDTVLALLLSEAVVTWFSGEGIERILELIVLILSLAVLRFVAIRYQPPRQEGPDFSAHSLALQKLLEVVRRKGNGKKNSGATQ
jgi:uncharacterized membrane protein (DUF373 family)